MNELITGNKLVASLVLLVIAWTGRPGGLFSAISANVQPVKMINQEDG